MKRIFLNVAILLASILAQSCYSSELPMSDETSQSEIPTYQEILEELRNMPPQLRTFQENLDRCKKFIDAIDRGEFSKEEEPIFMTPSMITEYHDRMAEIISCTTTCLSSFAKKYCNEKVIIKYDDTERYEILTELRNINQSLERVSRIIKCSANPEDPRFIIWSDVSNPLEKEIYQRGYLEATKDCPRFITDKIRRIKSLETTIKDVSDICHALDEWAEKQLHPQISQEDPTYLDDEDSDDFITYQEYDEDGNPKPKKPSRVCLISNRKDLTAILIQYMNEIGYFYQMIEWDGDGWILSRDWIMNADEEEVLGVILEVRDGTRDPRIKKKMDKIAREVRREMMFGLIRERLYLRGFDDPEVLKRHEIALSASHDSDHGL